MKTIDTHTHDVTLESYINCMIRVLTSVLDKFQLRDMVTHGAGAIKYHGFPLQGTLFP